MAIRALTAERPLALPIDDMQWADEDSLRLLRYAIRTEGASPIFVLFSIRPEELASLEEAVTLLADMERMRVVRRLTLARFSGGRDGRAAPQHPRRTGRGRHGVDDPRQAEGVPFIVEEIAGRTARPGCSREIADTWSLARNADRLAPSAVRTPIQRRAAHLPPETKQVLAEAALLGRHFSLKDLRELRLRIGEGSGDDPVALGNLMAPAVSTGPSSSSRRRRGRLQLPARAGPRVRGRHARAGSPARSTRRSSTSCSPASRRPRRSAPPITRARPATRRSA